jgi:hypothetical protein
MPQRKKVEEMRFYVDDCLRRGPWSETGTAPFNTKRPQSKRMEASGFETAGLYFESGRRPDPCANPLPKAVTRSVLGSEFERRRTLETVVRQEPPD